MISLQIHVVSYSRFIPIKLLYPKPSLIPHIHVEEGNGNQPRNNDIFFKLLSSFIFSLVILCLFFLSTIPISFSFPYLFIFSTNTIFLFFFTLLNFSFSLVSLFFSQVLIFKSVFPTFSFSMTCVVLKGVSEH